MGRRSYSYSVHSSSHTYKQESSIGYIFLPQVSGNAPEIHHENKLESCYSGFHAFLCSSPFTVSIQTSNSCVETRFYSVIYCEKCLIQCVLVNNREVCGNTCSNSHDNSVKYHCYREFNHEGNCFCYLCDPKPASRIRVSTKQIQNEFTNLANDTHKSIKELEEQIQNPNPNPNPNPPQINRPQLEITSNSTPEELLAMLDALKEERNEINFQREELEKEREERKQKEEKEIQMRKRFYNKDEESSIIVQSEWIVDNSSILSEGNIGQLNMFMSKNYQEHHYDSVTTYSGGKRWNSTTTQVTTKTKQESQDTFKSIPSSFDSQKQKIILGESTVQSICDNLHPQLQNSSIPLLSNIKSDNNEISIQNPFNQIQDIQNHDCSFGHLGKIVPDAIQLAYQSNIKKDNKEENLKSVVSTSLVICEKCGVSSCLLFSPEDNIGNLLEEDLVNCSAYQSLYSQLEKRISQQFQYNINNNLSNHKLLQNNSKSTSTAIQLPNEMIHQSNFAKEKITNWSNSINIWGKQLQQHCIVSPEFLANIKATHICSNNHHMYFEVILLFIYLFIIFIIIIFIIFYE